MKELLSLTEVRDALDDVEVRWLPGLTLEAYEDPWEGIVVRIVYETLNAYDATGRSTVVLGIDSYVPPAVLRSEKRLHEFIIWRLCRMVSHEVRESYTVAGERVVDPGHA